MKTGLENLIVFQKSMKLAMLIFEISKTFPSEEKYSMIDQIRRSSRSVCANLGEAYRKSRYEAHFISKLSDSDMENTETQIWLDFAQKCNYISKEQFLELHEISLEIGRMIDFMVQNPKKFARNS